MDFTAVEFAFAAYAAFLSSFFAPYGEWKVWHASTLSTGGMVFFWGANNTVYLIFPVWAYIISDSIFTLWALWLFRNYRLGFLGVLLPLYAANVLFDCLYNFGDMPYPTMMRIENVIFSVMLFVSPIHGLREIAMGLLGFGARVLRFSRRHRHEVDGARAYVSFLNCMSLEFVLSRVIPWRDASGYHQYQRHPFSYEP